MSLHAQHNHPSQAMKHPLRRFRWNRKRRRNSNDSKRRSPEDRNGSGTLSTETEERIDEHTTTTYQQTSASPVTQQHQHRSKRTREAPLRGRQARVQNRKQRRQNRRNGNGGTESKLHVKATQQNHGWVQSYLACIRQQTEYLLRRWDPAVSVATLPSLAATAFGIAALAFVTTVYHNAVKRLGRFLWRKATPVLNTFHLEWLRFRAGRDQRRIHALITVLMLQIHRREQLAEYGRKYRDKIMRHHHNHHLRLQGQRYG